MPFARRCKEGIQGEDWAKCKRLQRNEQGGMRPARSHMKPRKRKALWRMKAAWQAGEEYYDATREDNILGRTRQEQHFGKNTSKIQLVRWTSPEVVGKSVLKVSAQSALEKVLSPMAAVGFLRSLWEKPIWEGVWPYLDPMDTVCLRTASMEWNVPEKYGPHG